MLVAVILCGAGSAWGQNLTFDFEDGSAHRTSGSNSYTGTNTYTENGVTITLNYADAVTSGTPISGSANITARVAKNTQNSPTVVIGPIANTGYKITTISFKAKGSTKNVFMALHTSSDNTNWTSRSSAKSYSSTTTETINNLAIEDNNVYLKFTVSVSSSTSSNRDMQLDDIVITRESTGTLTSSDLAITGSPVALSFDLYNNSESQTVSYTTSSTGAVTVSGGTGYVTTSVDVINKTITVTPTAKTPSAQTITVNQAADDNYQAGTATFTVSIDDSTPATNYVKVTNANQLVAGNEYILVASTSNASFAMGSMGSNLRNSVSVTDNNDVVSIQNEEVAVLTLGGSIGAWTFLASDNNEYLSYSGSSNQLHSSSAANDNASKWIITDEFKLESANVTGRYLQYNASSPRFACYTATQTDAYLYVKEGSAINTKTDPAFSFSANSVEANVGESFTAPTFSNPNNVSVTFSSSDPSVASITNEGVVTLLAAGTTVISATSVEDDNYLAGTASYTLTVTDPNAPGTENNPYTVAQAIGNAPESGISANVYIRGIVSAFYNTNIMGDGSNYRYYISDDGTTNNQLVVYKGKGLNNVAFANADDLRIGDIVTIYGGLNTYNSAAQVASGNYIVSLNRPDVSTTVNIGELTNVTSVSMWYVGDGSEMPDIESGDVVEPETEIFVLPYAAEGYTIQSVTVVDANGNPVNVTENDGNWSFIMPNSSVTINATATSSVTPGTGDQYQLFTGELVEGDYIIYYDGYAMNTTVTSDRLQYEEVTPSSNIITTDNAAIVWHIAPSGEYWTIYNADANAYAASTGAKNKAQMLADGTDDKALWAVTLSDGTYEFVNKKNTANSVNANLRNNGDYGFACYGTTIGGALSLYKKVEATPDYTRTKPTSSVYGTLCLPYDATITGGTLYNIASASFTDPNTPSTLQSITLVEFGTTAEAGKGYIIKFSADEMTATFTSTNEVSTPIANNGLIGNPTTTGQNVAAGASNFVLQAGQLRYCNTVAATNGKYRAYIDASQIVNQEVPAGVKSINLFLNGADAIDGINSVIENAEIYNIAGQRMNKLQRGVNIVNGKKVLVK